MKLFVPHHIVPTCKSLSALTALVGSYPFVTVLMVFQNRLPGEALPTYGASSFCLGRLNSRIVETFGEIANFRMERSGVSGVI